MREVLLNERGFTAEEPYTYSGQRFDDRTLWIWSSIYSLWHFNISYALDMQNMKLHTYSFPAVADQSD